MTAYFELSDDFLSTCRIADDSPSTSRLESPTASRAKTLETSGHSLPSFVS
jgi:hypothetical protein